MMVYYGAMSTTTPPTEQIRRSISLAPQLAEKIDAIAEARRVSTNRAIVDLLEDAIAAYGQRRKAFFDVAERFRNSKDPKETEKLRQELARLTFGE